MTLETNKREYLALPLAFCYFDRTRYDRLKKELPTEIISFRKYDHGLLRVHFSTREVGERATAGKVSMPSSRKTPAREEPRTEGEERFHLLWIQLVELEGTSYVKYRCDCKYFEFRQLRVARRLFDRREVAGELLVVVQPQAFEHTKGLFNLDKHAFLALHELLNVQIPVTV